jgi:Ala-tRNA(Pro) deacylase
MPTQKLKDYLDSNRVKYQLISHPTTYTAQGTAATSHIGGDELAKAVVIKLDDAFAMAVLPASRRIDLASLQTAAGAKAVRLASELEFKDLFPDCETGAMPPLGNLYGMRVFVDESLSKDKEIAFNAGSHDELVRLAYEDFERLVTPNKATFALGGTSGRAA